MGQRYTIFPHLGWMKQLVKWLLPPTQRGHVVLLLDGHSSHKDLRTSKLAKDNRTVQFCLPPHCTHILQPLDKGYMKLLKYEWKKACHEFTRENNGHHIDKISFARVFSKAHLAMAEALTIFNAFRSCGILPVCPDVIDYKSVHISSTFLSVVMEDQASFKQSDGSSSSEPLQSTLNPAPHK